MMLSEKLKKLSHMTEPSCLMSTRVRCALRILGKLYRSTTYKVVCVHTSLTQVRTHTHKKKGVV